MYRRSVSKMAAGAPPPSLQPLTLSMLQTEVSVAIDRPAQVIDGFGVATGEAIAGI
jgi:hypothetical protein